jgi:hypothetical protein
VTQVDRLWCILGRRTIGCGTPSRLGERGADRERQREREVKREREREVKRGQERSREREREREVRGGETERGRWEETDGWRSMDCMESEDFCNLSTRGRFDANPVDGALAGGCRLMGVKSSQRESLWFIFVSPWYIFIRRGSLCRNN